jgi:hypothetical protein
MYDEVASGFLRRLPKKAGHTVGMQLLWPTIPERQKIIFYTSRIAVTAR